MIWQKRFCVSWVSGKCAKIAWHVDLWIRKAMQAPKTGLWDFNRIPWTEGLPSCFASHLLGRDFACLFSSKGNLSWLIDLTNFPPGRWFREFHWWHPRLSFRLSVDCPLALPLIFLANILFLIIVIGNQRDEFTLRESNSLNMQTVTMQHVTQRSNITQIGHLSHMYKLHNTRCALCGQGAHNNPRFIRIYISFESCSFSQLCRSFCIREKENIFGILFSLFLDSNYVGTTVRSESCFLETGNANYSREKIILK